MPRFSSKIPGFISFSIPTTFKVPGFLTNTFAIFFKPLILRALSARKIRGLKKMAILLF